MTLFCSNKWFQQGFQNLLKCLSMKGRCSAQYEEVPESSDKNEIKPLKFHKCI